MRTTLAAAILAALATAGAAAQQPMPDVGPATKSMDQAMAEAPTGSLAIQVVQGTEGGPTVGSVEVQVDLYHLNHAIKTLTATVDESGVALLENVPLPVEVRPVARLEYGGVTYLEVGEPLSPQRNEGVVKVMVYETTTDEPQWQVAMRHVMVEPHSDGAAVAETLVVENPGDRTWLGAPTESGDDRPTIRVRLPEGADQVQLESGFHGWCCTTYAGRDLVVKMPLMPGSTSFRFRYHVPAVGRSADISVSSPVATTQTVFFVPQGGPEVSPVALQHFGTEQMGQMSVDMYSAAGLGGDTEAGVVLAGLTSAAPAMPVDETAAGAQRAALIGVGVVLVAGVGFVAIRLLKRPAAPVA